MSNGIKSNLARSRASIIQAKLFEGKEMDSFPSCFFFFGGAIVATHNLSLCPNFANQCFIKMEIFIATMHYFVSAPLSDRSQSPLLNQQKWRDQKHWSCSEIYTSVLGKKKKKWMWDHLQEEITFFFSFLKKSLCCTEDLQSVCFLCDMSNFIFVIHEFLTFVLVCFFVYLFVCVFSLFSSSQCSVTLYF